MDCEKYQEELTDYIYEEIEMSEELESHLENCPTCAEYYQSLLEINDQLGQIELEQSLSAHELHDINQAFTQAEKIIDKRELITDLLKFTGILGLIVYLYYLIYQWIGLQGTLKVYMVLYFLMPFSLLPLMKLRQTGRNQ